MNLQVKKEINKIIFIMKKEIAKNELLKLGFKLNNKIINGFKPHFINEKEDVVFLIGKDFWINKIYDIKTAFKNYENNIFGILLDNTPKFADKDWITNDYLILISINPLKKNQ